MKYDKDISSLAAKIDADYDSVNHVAKKVGSETCKNLVNLYETMQNKLIESGDSMMFGFFDFYRQLKYTGKLEAGMSLKELQEITPKPEDLTDKFNPEEICLDPECDYGRGGHLTRALTDKDRAFVFEGYRANGDEVCYVEQDRLTKNRPEQFEPDDLDELIRLLPTPTPTFSVPTVAHGEMRRLNEEKLKKLLKDH